MLPLPPSLTRHFVDASGHFAWQALLRTPDARLVAVAREMEPEERVALYRRLWGLKVSGLERFMAQAAGVDIDRQRLRFMNLLEEAHAAEEAASRAEEPAVAGAV